MLLGRQFEQRAVDELLTRARRGQSAVMVLRGEAGIGKTALLEYAQRQAAGMTVLRCVGIEAEHELPFAGLHQLLRPCLEKLDALPQPQAAALRGAFGLSAARVESQFLVALGVLSLLADASESTPALCLIDDGHWLDRASQDAIAFAARRFVAEPIALLVASRTGEGRSFPDEGLPTHELSGLDDDHARALLQSRAASTASAAVIDMVLRACQGNPLALEELPAGLSARQLAGAEPITGPLPARGVVEERFRARVTKLPESVRRALLLVAVDEGDETAALERALERSNVAPSALREAEHAGLVRIDGGITFRHPLVRSAVYGAATHSERRAAHESLATALEDPVRTTWHMAAIAERADEAIASKLDAAAEQAASRGAYVSAAAAFERAAELSERPLASGRRFMYASQSSLGAGRWNAALALAERAAALLDDPADTVELDFVRAAVSSRTGSPSETFALVRRAAGLLAQRQPDRALEMVAYMILSAQQGGWTMTGIPEASKTLAGIDGGGSRKTFMRAVIAGAEFLLRGDGVRARERFDDALSTERRLTGDPIAAALAGMIGFWTADYELARDRFARLVAQRRVQGSLTELVTALFSLAASELCCGRAQAGFDAADEGLGLARQFGYVNSEISYLALQAWIGALFGKELECRELAHLAIRRGLANGVGYATAEGHLALGQLELGLGNPEAAIEHFDYLDPSPFPPLAQLATPEVVDAALRLGQPERAALALDRFAAWAPVSRAPLVAGMLARCRGMITADSKQADSLFLQALHHHDHRVAAYDRARTQLAYGERLRRDRRRLEARAQLRSALDAFEGIGASLWAERARTELRATGETARRRNHSTVDQLTAQELRIARLVAGGASNKDVAAQLFLSRRTVEYHLGKVFTKLGVSSRVELARTELEPAIAARDHSPE